MSYRTITPQEIPIVADIQARAFRFPADRYLEAYSGSGRVDHTALRVSIGDGAAAVQSASASLQGRTDMAVWSQLYAGAMTAEQARTVGALHGDDASPAAPEGGWAICYPCSRRRHASISAWSCAPSG